MSVLHKLKKFDNLHILIWLIKDTCWMLEFKWLGIVMIIPTICIALLIIYYTFYTIDIYINFGILFWICANSFWMYSEFFNNGAYKLMASIPFGLGFICVGFFYLKQYTAKINELKLKK